MACTAISTAYTFCDLLTDAGVKTDLYLCPLADWLNATVTVDGTSNNIDSITNASGKRFYKWEVGQASNVVAGSAVRAQAGGLNGFDHSVDMKIAATDQAQGDEIKLLLYSKVVVILPLNNGSSYLYGGGADSTPEPIGLGLKMTGGDLLPGDATVAGLIQLILTTDPDGSPEANRPWVIDSTVDLTALETPGS